MANWKRQVGALNAMGKTQAKLNTRAVIETQKAERIARLVAQMKEREGG